MQNAECRIIGAKPIVKLQMASGKWQVSGQADCKMQNAKCRMQNYRGFADYRFSKSNAKPIIPVSALPE